MDTASATLRGLAWHRHSHVSPGSVLEPAVVRLGMPNPCPVPAARDTGNSQGSGGSFRAISPASAGRGASAAVIPVCAERGRCCASSKQGFAKEGKENPRKIQDKSIPNGESFEKAKHCSRSCCEVWGASPDWPNPEPWVTPTCLGLCFCPSHPHGLKVPRALELPDWTSWRFLSSRDGEQE